MRKHLPFNAVDAYKTELQEAKITLGFSPTADIVEVVRCKDCKYCVVLRDVINRDQYFCTRAIGSMPLKETDFCSYGERRKEDGNADR